jgi:nucleoside-diphosphate-sugar epimerase
MKVGEILDLEGETFNLGAGFEIEVGELAREIIALIGRPMEILVDPSRLRPRKSEVERLLSDNHRARDRLGWQPQISLKDGLKRTIQWIEEYLELYRPSIFQI